MTSYIKKYFVRTGACKYTSNATIHIYKCNLCGKETDHTREHMTKAHPTVRIADNGGYKFVPRIDCLKAPEDRYVGTNETTACKQNVCCHMCNARLCVLIR